MLLHNWKNFLKNVWLYRKELRDDRQWDFAFIFMMLKRKMQLLHTGLNKDYRVLLKHHDTHNQYLRDLRQCIHICDLLDTEDFELEEALDKDGKNYQEVCLDRLHFYMRRSCRHWWS